MKRGEWIKTKNGIAMVDGESGDVVKLDEGDAAKLYLPFGGPGPDYKLFTWPDTEDQIVFHVVEIDEDGFVTLDGLTFMITVALDGDKEYPDFGFTNEIIAIGDGVYKEIVLTDSHFPITFGRRDDGYPEGFPGENDD